MHGICCFVAGLVYYFKFKEDKHPDNEQELEKEKMEHQVEMQKNITRETSKSEGEQDSDL